MSVREMLELDDIQHILLTRTPAMTGRYEFPYRGWGPLEQNDVDLPGALGKAGKPSMLVTPAAA